MTLTTLRGKRRLENELAAVYFQEGIGYATDDVSNELLDPELVVDARKTEMTFFEYMKVYDRVDRAEMIRRRGKIIKTRWIDANKGDRQEKVADLMTKNLAAGVIDKYIDMLNLCFAMLCYVYVIYRNNIILLYCV